MTTVSFDEHLWFTMGSHCPGKHYLLGNCHTFHGRMTAWCPLKSVSFCVSRDEMDHFSSEAAYWMHGFLKGNEPGPPRNTAGDLLPPTDARHQRWRAAVTLFSETGLWMAMTRTCDQCGDELLPSQRGVLCLKCIAQTRP